MNNIGTFRKKNTVISILLAFYASVGMSLQLTVISTKDILEDVGSGMTQVSGVFRLLWDIKMSLHGYSNKELLLFVLLSVAFIKILQMDHSKRAKKFAIVISFIFSFFEVFGTSFQNVSSWEQITATGRNVIKAVIKFGGLAVLFYVIILLLIYLLDRVKIQADFKDKNWFTFNVKSLIVVAGLILVMWLPYAVADFPGLTNYDFFDELDSFYGHDTNSIRAVNLISPDVTLNNNNPVLQTMFAVGTMKLGSILGSPYIGIFAFCFVQMILLALVMSYSIYYMAKWKVRPIIRVLTLLFYGLLPIHANFALTTLKDTNFAFIMLLYLIMIARLVLERDVFFSKKRNLVLFGVLSLTLMLLRNNGMYVLVVAQIILLVALRKEWKKLILPIVIPFFLYIVVITNVIYPMCKIAPGSKAEMYSVPFQQIARVVKEHGSEISKQDQAVIRKIIKYDELAERYDPQISDPVKSTFNKKATSEDMSAFYQVWFKLLKKYPSTFVQATMNNCYGYFYPEAKNWLVYISIAPPGERYGVKSPEVLSQFRLELNQMVYLIRQLPGVGLLLSVGFYTWILILAVMYLCYKKEKEKLLVLAPIIILLLTVLIGPVNTMLRYVYPMVLAMPLILVVTLYKNSMTEKNQLEEVETDI